MKSIREQIIENVAAYLGRIRSTTSYNTDIGMNIVRGRLDQMPSEIPSIVLIIGQDSAEQVYSGTTYTTPVTLEAFSLFGTHNPAIVAEQILSDLITCMISPRVDLDFTDGSVEPSIGMIILGGTSGALCTIESIHLSSGSWAGGDAAGYFRTILQSDTFESEALKNQVSGQTIAQTPGTVAISDPLSILVNKITYVNGGIQNLPEPGETFVKVPAIFDIEYATLTGNPYRQQ